MISTVGSWVILVTIAGIAIYCATMFVRYRSSDSWSVTSGKIESYDKPSYPDGASTCYTTVRYSYSVNDDYYSGTWLTPFLPNLPALNQFLAAELPVGKSVEVRYKPGKPDRSVLADPPAPAPPEIVMKTNFSG